MLYAPFFVGTFVVLGIYWDIACLCLQLRIIVDYACRGPMMDSLNPCWMVPYGGYH